MKCKKFRSLIEPYLQDKLIEPQLSAFEIHYFNCQQCFQELNLIKNLRHPGLFRGSMSKESFQHKQHRLTFPIAIAASVLIVFFSLLLMINFFHRNAQIEVEAPPFVLAETRNNSIDDQIKLGFELYNRKEYARAAEIFASYPQYCQQVIFYRGICYLMIGDYTRAIIDFDEIISRMSPSYHDDALFYKAVTLIKMKRKDEAQTILKDLTQLFSPMQAKAEELLERIN